MGNLTQTTAQVQTDLDAVEASNAGLTSVTDLSDTTAAAAKKSGFHALQASSTNAPSTDRAVLISAVRNTAASGEIRYGQVAITESNGLWWNSDDNGTLGTWAQAASINTAQTISGAKTITGNMVFNSATLDVNGNELILDADADTSITADTDDQIDVKIAGADDFQFTANTFTALSGSTIKANTIAETTSASGVTIDSVLLKDNTVLAGTMTVAAGSLTDSSNAIDFGAAALTTSGNITTSAGDLTVSAGDIVIGTEGAGLIRSVDTSYTRISGGSSVSSGANMLLHGGNAGVASGDMTFRADNTAWFFYDHSATELSVKNTTNFIVEAGDLTLSTGSVTAGTEIKSQGGSASVSAGEATLSGNATSGAVVQGNGSGYDISIQNKSSSVAMRVPTGTTNVQLPSGDLTVSAGDLKVSAGFLNFGAKQSVTCDTNGDIAVTGSRYKVIPFGGAGIGADTLNHATGGSDGDMLILSPNDGTADPITIAHATAGAGGFYFHDSAARVLNSSTDQATFIHDGTNWVYTEAGTS